MELSLGDRMKMNYENRYRIKLTRRTPVIIRLDGKSFHTFCKNFNKPFDNRLSEALTIATLTTLNEIQGSKCAYIQSDEVSILLTDFDRFVTCAWFDYNLQKIVSISAAIMSVTFVNEISKYVDRKLAVFDSRAFNLPKEEVVNYFIWRQRDWVKNSVQMLARSAYSHMELYNKNISDLHELLHEKGLNWANLDDKWKNGVFIYKNDKTFKISHKAIFTTDKWRNIINTYLYNIEQ